MATVDQPRTILGPADHGRRMSYDEFLRTEWTEGWGYELARGVVVVTHIPGPDHGFIVGRLTELFVLYNVAHPGLIRYRAGGAECRLRLPGMQSDRHPDQAVYLRPRPRGPRVWERWVPDLVVEVVSKRGEDRDFVEKREEYLRIGVTEYWIIDPEARRMHVLSRRGDVWAERVLGEADVHRTDLLPGLEVHVGAMIGDEPMDDADAIGDD